MKWLQLLILFYFVTPVIAKDCNDFLNLNLEKIIVTEATLIKDDGDLPSFCRVRGVINPDIGFEARLPDKNWNGKFFQAGCGGFCGLIEPDRNSHSNAINHALRKGYAAITTNGGHQGKHLGDAEWAKGNPAARKVYAFTVIKFTYDAGHHLIKRFYNQKPDYSYFSGCSNGGRLAAKAAQIYPNLFDGIISGCPILNLTENAGIFGPWLLQSNLNDKKNEILTIKFNAKLVWLEKYVLDKCDGLDGSYDGVIQNVNECNLTFDDIKICDQSTKNECLSLEEKNTLLKLYAGPSNAAGEKLFYGINPGSERYLGYWYFGSKENPRPGTLLADGFLPNFGFNFEKNFRAVDFNFDSHLEKLKLQSDLLNATNPDLKNFFESNGKLLMWAGLADPLVLPQQTVDYYKNVRKLFGNNTDKFFKLFLVPGMGHCWEMESRIPDQMSMLTVIENWVEKEISPDFIPIKSLNMKSEVKDGFLRPFPLMAEY